MTRRQRGQVFKLGDGTWAYRYRAKNGKRPQKGGYRRQGDASAALREAMDRDRGGYRAPITLGELVAVYMESYPGAKGSRDRLTWNLSKLGALASLPVDRIVAHDIERWRASLPEAWRYHAFGALRQVLNAGVRWKYLQASPLAGVANPQQVKPEIQPFTRIELSAIMGQMTERDALIVRFLADTGLRPGELIALERRDLDLRGRLVHVNRSYSRGELRVLPKNGARRSVPLRSTTIKAVSDAPVRIDARLLFPGDRGGRLDWHNWRARQWKDALDALDGVPYRQPYALRHTYATESIQAGIPLFTLARRMGTSIKMIEATYGHLAADSMRHELDLLDAYDASLLGGESHTEETQDG